MADLSSKTKKWLKYVFIGVSVLIIAGMAGWFFVARPILVTQEKERFEKAAASLEQLAEEIQTKIGKADEVKNEESCGYSSAKFSKGNLSCWVRIELKYPGYDLPRSNRVMTDISNLFGTTLYPGSGNFDKTSFEDLPRAEQSFSQEFEKDKLLCKTAYLYTDITKFRTLQPTRVSGLVVSLSCSGSAIAEHFSLDG